MLYHIVFGVNASAPNALRVSALLPLLPAPNVKLSPHAICKASQSAMREFIRHGVDLDNNPLVAEMANRFLSSGQFPYLLKNSRNITAFCNLSAEHFQLLEIAPGSRDSALTITQPFHSLSFRIKAESDQCIGVSVLQTELCSLMLSNNTLILCIGESQYTLPFEPKAWSLITLSYIHEHPKSTFILTCNKKTTSATFKASPPELTTVTFGSFETICQIRWFIGSSIRLFNIQAPYIQLASLGPGSTSQIAGETIFTPNSEMTKRGDGALPVPYCGFPWFFQIRKHMVDAVEEILKAKDLKRVTDIVSAMFNALSLFPNISDFWLQIKTIIKEKPELISPEMINKIFTVLFSSVRDESELNLIIADIDIWYFYEEQLMNALIASTEKKMFKLNIKQNKLAATISTMMDLSDKKLHYIKCLTRLAFLENSSIYYMHIYHYYIMSDSALKYQILECLVNSLFKDYSAVVDIISNASEKLTSMIVNLMIIISAHNPSFIRDDETLSLALMQELKTHDIWIQLLSIATSTTLSEYHSTPISFFDSLF